MISGLETEVKLTGGIESDHQNPAPSPFRKHLAVLRPGESARGIAQWQYGLRDNGEAGAFIRRCPPPGATWRHSRPKIIAASRLSPEQVVASFESLSVLIGEHHAELLHTDDLWADTSEKANNITRAQRTNTACVWVGLYEDGHLEQTFYLPEDSPLLLAATFYRVAEALVAPHL